MWRLSEISTAWGGGSSACHMWSNTIEGSITPLTVEISPGMLLLHPPIKVIWHPQELDIASGSVCMAAKWWFSDHYMKKISDICARDNNWVCIMLDTLWGSTQCVGWCINLSVWQNVQYCSKVWNNSDFLFYYY